MQDSRKKFLILYMCWWLFWTLVQTFVLHRLDQDWQTSFIDSLVSNALLAILALGALIVFRFYQPGVQLTLSRLGYALVITVLYCFLLQQLLVFLLPDHVSYHAFLEKSMPLRFILALLILSFVAIINWLYAILQDQKKQEQRRNEAETLLKDAELFRLRQQLQPHFLFNSLNSISALAVVDPPQARKMIQQLSDFLRGTVKKEKENLVMLKDEIEHLRLYLEIEMVRFGDRLNVKVEVEPDAEKLLLPPLLIQPLAENAIKFGLYGTIEAIDINLRASREGSFLNVTIANPFNTQVQKESKGTGFGLDSVTRRLLLIYGRADLLKTTSENEYFKSTLLIPQ